MISLWRCFAAQMRRPFLAGLLLMVLAPISATMPGRALAGNVTTFAGPGPTSLPGVAKGGYSGDGGLATDAGLNNPAGIAVDLLGNIYIADYANHCVRMVDAAGYISTVAGTGGVLGYNGDGVATASRLYSPMDVAVDPDGNLYVAEYTNHLVRKIDMQTGLLSTVAGVYTTNATGSPIGGYNGDNIQATAAQLDKPTALALDAAGNLYIADSGNQVIRRIDRVTGNMTIVAGTVKTAGAPVDGVLATSTLLNTPRGIAFDVAGNMYIADSNNRRIRKVDAATGIITTFAGGAIAWVDDSAGIPATSAYINLPYHIAFDMTGNLFVSDQSNHLVRKVTPAGIITTIAGTKGVFTPFADNVAPTLATLYAPRAVVPDMWGNLYIADAYNQRIRMIVSDTPPPPNNPPVANGQSVEANEDIPLGIVLSGSDSDGQIVGFEIGTPPSHGILSGSGAVRTYTPAVNYEGSDSFTFRARDNRGGLSDWATVGIVVHPINDPPAISGVPATSVSQGSPYSFSPTATDIDAVDIQIFSIANKPGWAQFSSGTGELSGTPGNAHVGMTVGIVITVTDGSGASASLPPFSLSVVNVNDPPQIGGTPAADVVEGSLYRFVPTASDPDADPLVFSFNTLPSWASFDVATGELSGTPGYSDAGTTAGVVITVSDGSGASDSLPPFDLEVVNFNNPPVISGTPSAYVIEGVPYSFIPTASEPDGEAIDFAIVNPPVWASFDPATGALSGTPGAADIGMTANIEITVTDAGGASSSLGPFAIVVSAAMPPPPGVGASVAASGTHSAAIKPDNSFWGWGSNGNGQVGDGSKELVTSPLRIGTDTDWTQLALGYYHSLALKSDGSLWAWGRNFEGQLGTGTTVGDLAPVPTGDADGDGTPDHDWTAVAAGTYHTVAVKSDGTLWSWGGNLDGQLGIGTRDKQLSPIRVGTDSNWKSVAAGFSFTLAIRNDGTLWAWGDNYAGQLGTGGTSDELLPVQVGAGVAWYSVTAGLYHALAIDASGRLWGWGHNDYGQLGDGNGLDTPLPILLGSDTWKTVAAGNYHTAAIRADGTLWTWGANDWGQLGDGNGGLGNFSLAAVQVNTEADWIDAAAGAGHTVALKADGRLLSWGSNGNGQLGDGTVADSFVPVEILPDLFDITPTVATVDPFTTPTNQQSQVFSGEIEPGATLEVTVDTVASVGVVSYPTVGTWSCTISGFAPGSNQLSLVATDASHNVGEPVLISVVYDPVPPTVSISPPPPALTNQSSLTLTGAFGDAVEVGRVTVAVDTAAAVGAVVTSGGSNWSCTITGLVAGPNTATVTHIDKAGNSASVQAVILYDGIPPAAPVMSGVTPNNSNRPDWSWTSGGNGGNGSYRYRLDGGSWNDTTATVFTPAAPLTEGGHLLEVEERDAAGNWSASGSLTIVVDTVAPTVAIAGPADGSLVRQPVLDFTVSDGAVRVLVNGTEVAAASGDTLALADGDHLLRVEATDAAGNVGAAESSFSLDTIPPVVSLFPVSSPVQADAQQLNGTVESGATVTVATDTAAVGGSAAVVGGFWLFEVTGLVEGLNTLTVTAADAAGNQAEPIVAVVVRDTVPPSVSLLSPGSGTATADSTPPLIFTVSDGTVVVKVDGAVVPKNAGDSLDPLADGLHIVRIEATDEAGNLGFVESSFSVDTVVPVVSVTSPADGMFINLPSPSLDFNVSEAGNIVVTVDGVEAPLAPGDLLGPLTDGVHNVRVSVTDAAGNIGFSQADFSVDTVAPTVSITAPAEGMLGNDAAPLLEYTVSDGTVVVTVDGIPVVKNSGDRLDPLGDGAHTVGVEATDAAGNVGFAMAALTIDTVPPQVPMVVGATPVITATPTWSWSSGGGGGNSVYRYKLDDSDLSAGATETTAVSFTSSTALTEGSHTLYVQERDAAGNWSASGMAAIEIDLTPPEVPVVDGATPVNTGTPTWNWVSGGGGNGFYRYRLEDAAGGVLAVDLKTALTSFTPAAALAEGTYTLFVQEWDAAGNWSASGQRSVTVDLTAPGVPAVDGVSPVNTVTPTWNWVSSGGSGTYRYKLDDPDLATGSTETAATTFTPATPLSEGTHTLYVQERDEAGNWSPSGQRTIEIDLTPPAAPVVNGASPVNTVMPTWSWTSGGGGNGTYRYKLDDPDLAAGATQIAAPGFTAPTALAEGTHTLYVQESDAAGNWSASGSREIVVDLALPLLTIGPVESPINIDVQTVGGTIEAGLVNFTVSVDTGATVGAPVFAPPDTWSCQISGLYEGMNKITVSATDVAGNTGTAEAIIVLDTLPPALAIDPVTSPTRVDSQLIGGTIETGLEINAITVDTGAAASAVTYPTSDTWSCLIVGLAEGDNNVAVTAIDAAGNVAMQTALITLALGGPVITIDDPVSPTAETSQAISGTVEPGAILIRIDLNGTVIDELPFDPAATTWSYTLDGLQPGENLVTVEAEDALGNLTGDAASIFVTSPAFGKMSIDSSWKTLAAPATLLDPVLIVGPPTRHDAAPGVAQVKANGSGSFSLRFAEWSHLDGAHAAENVAYMLLDQGRYPMPDGSIWEVGRFDLSGDTGAFSSRSFASPFAMAPALFLSLQSVNEADPVTVRARNVTASSFEVALFEEEGKNGGHGTESVAYLAIYSPNGSGTTGFGGLLLPYLLQKRALDSSLAAVLGSSLQLQEEQSLDTETTHPAETVDVLALGSLLFAQTVSSVSGDTTSLRQRAPEFMALVEWGAVVLDDGDWLTVPLAKRYAQPVVVVKPASGGTNLPGYIQVRNVTVDSFDLRYGEWAGTSPGQPVQVFYLVAESGQQTLGGLAVEAGTRTASVTYPAWQGVGLGPAFAGRTPAVFAGVQTAAGGTPLVTRVQGCTAAGFDLTLQGAEAFTGALPTQTVGWIAMAKGIGTTEDGHSLMLFGTTAGDSPATTDFVSAYQASASNQAVDSKFARRYPKLAQAISQMNFTQRFSLGATTLIGDIVSTYEGDTATLRYRSLSQGGVELFIEEETTRDAEMIHALEDVSVFLAD